MIMKRETLNEVKPVAFIGDSQATYQRIAYLELVPGQQLLESIDWRAHTLLADGITTEFHMMLAYSSTAEQEEVD
jgi:hypothetical protein